MADTPRMQALKNLSNQLPVANSRVASGQDAARQMQLQNAIKAAPVGSATTSTAQTTGAATAQNAGAQLIDTAKQNMTSQGQLASTGLQQQAIQNQGDVSSLAAGSREQEMDNVQRLAALSQNTKQELYDRQMQFQKDELGRTKFNEAQLADYARTKAQSDQEFQNYSQAAQQMAQRKLQIMEVAYSKLSADIDLRMAVAEQEKDQKSMIQLANTKKELSEEMQKQKNKAANNSAMWSTVGTIGGVAVGSLGGPAGAAAGGSVGGALGGLAGSQF